MIAQKSIEQVLETARVEDIVGEYVNLKRRGVNLIGLCPFHNEKTPSFTVSPAKNIYKCFGCGEGGGPVQFLMQHENQSFPEAIRTLAKKYGIELEETQLSAEVIQERQKQDSLYLVNQFALEFFQDQLLNTDMGKSVGLSYFKQRGYDEEIIRKFGLGFAPANSDALTRAATAQGYDQELLKELGLMSKAGKDFFRKRVMFTIRNLSGKVIAFAGRILEKNVKAPKYINSPETDVYHKSKVLFGAYLAKGPIRKQDECILVEGYTDVISLHQAGIENVVASSGTSLTEGQVRLIKRFTPNIKILYDGDPAGVKAALRGLDIVLAQDMNVKVVLLPEGEDPDSYVKKVGSTAFQEYLDQEAKDFIFFKAALLMQDSARDPVKRSEAVKDIVGSIAKIPDPLKRTLYIQECAKLTELEEQLLVMEVNKVLGQTIRKRKEEQDRQVQRPQGPEEHAPLHNPSGAGAVGKPQGDEFQEKDIVRILISGGHHWYDEEAQVNIATFVLSSLEDVLDAFDHPPYLQVVQDYLEQLTNGNTINSNYFINHPDQTIQNLAITLLSSPYEYSENWEKRHDIFLDQKRPEENFRKDAEIAVRRLRIRKIKRKMEQVKEKITELSASDSDEVMDYMKLFGKLKEMHDQLAKELGSVVL